ncbi:MAG: OsmC family protein [bacterium]
MAEVKWVEGMKFTAVSDSGSKFIFDTTSETIEAEAGSFKPMEMLLLSLAGCTAMDTVSILVKMREQLKEFKITVDGTRRGEHPKIFTNITLHYHLKGVNLDEDKVKKAINLSQEKYCSVSAMLKQSAEVKFTYEIENI